MPDFAERAKRILGHAMREFGTTVTYYRVATNQIYKFKGVFNNEFVNVDPDTESVIAMNQPALGVNLNDIDFDIDQGDRIKIREFFYIVIDKQEDGQGGAMIFLEKENGKSKSKDTRAR